jgi:hypothetical protein
MLALVTNDDQRFSYGCVGDWIAQVAYIVLLVAVAAAAALCGFVASTVARRKRQRARRFFMVGFFCGFTAGVVVRRKWRETARLAVRTFNSAVLPGRLGHSPPRTRRLPMALSTVRR